MNVANLAHQVHGQSLKPAVAQALSLLQSVGWPTRKSEAWKHTNAQSFLRADLRAASRQDAHALDVGAIAADVVVVDGFVRKNAVAQAGVEIIVLSEMPGVVAEPNAFAHLNQALLVTGLQITVTGVCPQPVQIVYVTTSSTVAATRSQIHVAAHGQATVIEKFMGAGPSLSSHSCDISVAHGAELNYLKTAAEGALADHVGAVKCVQEQDSQTRLLHYCKGGRMARHEVHAVLAGTGAKTSVNAFSLTQDQQHIDHYTWIEHAAPSTVSAQLYKNILDHQSRTVFNGTIKMGAAATGSQARQLNRNLLLSSQAEADSRPQLQIDVDDVKANHGSTTGPLEEEEVFYLMSRAIPRAEAIRILAHGFAQEVLSDWPATPWRTQLQHEWQVDLASQVGRI